MKLPKLGRDMFCGDSNSRQPDWRRQDPDDKISDNDDPSPVSREILVNILGFDPDKLDDLEDEDDKNNIKKR